LGTDDSNSDSDNDGLNDYAEVMVYKSDPTKADTDEDGLSDGREVNELGISPIIPVWLEGGIDGFLQVDRWNNMSGSTKINGLIFAPRFGVQVDAHYFVDVSEQPLDTTHRFGVRIRGTVTVPEAGVYKFRLSAKKAAQVWFSDTASPYNRKLLIDQPIPVGYHSLTPSQVVNRTAEKSLTSNQVCYVEILLKTAKGGGHATLWWQRPGSTLWEVIPAQYLHSYEQPSDDQDQDGLPDAWETANGLNSNNGRGGGYLDHDGDLISDIEEYQQGGSPFFSGSGYVASENNLVGSGSLEPLSTSTLLEEKNGSEIFKTKGIWVIQGSKIYAASRRGEIQYKKTFAENSIYQIDFQIKQHRVVKHGVKKLYRLRFTVDGEFVSRKNIALVGVESKVISIQTPFLSAGEHVVSMLWDNYENDLSLEVEKVSFLQGNGVDSNGNGILDWVENRVISRNNIYVSPSESRTSPVCLEGMAKHLSLMTFSSGGEIFPAQNGRWFGNLPLNSDGVSHNYSISFENAARTLSRAIRWKPTNLLLDSIQTPIRRGDALLLSAIPESGMTTNGVFELFVNGMSIATTNRPVAYIFATNGIYQLRGVYSTAGGASEERTVSVEVVGEDPIVIASLVGKPRVCSFPTNRVVELDAQLVRGRNKAGDLTLKTDVPEELYGVVRLGQNGPVLTTVTVKGFNMWFMRNTYLYYDKIFDNGSFSARTTMIMSPLLPEVWVDQRCRYGVSYEDGSRRHSFYSTDFSELGEVEILFFHATNRPSSVCHYTELYQNDIFIGRCY